MKMKNAAISVGVMGLSLTPFAVMLPTASASTNDVATVHGWVSYHSAPALKSRINGRLHLGDKVPLIRKANAYWYEISVSGHAEYITTNKKYIKLVSSSTPRVASSTASVKSSTTASSNDVETVHGWVSYHSAPALKSNITGRLQLGDKAPLIRKANSYWYEISVNGQPEYITTSTNFIKVVSSSTPTVPGVSTGTSSPSPAPVTSGSWQAKADAVVAAAKTQLGVPYLWGHQLPGVGFDCSNFSEWAFHKALGMTFTTSSVAQRDRVGTPVALSNIREGDLLFFKTANNSTGGGHVGIYMGNGQVIQEGGGWGKVTIEPLNGTWLGRNLVFARRVIN